MPTSSTARRLEPLRDEPAPDTDALAEVRAEVNADAQNRPEAYLADTLVPEGGE